MRDTNSNSSFVFLALSPCVLIKKYLHVAGLGLGLSLEDLALASASWFDLTLASEFWPRPQHFCLVNMTTEQSL